MKRGGFVKRSACLQRIRCDRRLEKRFSGRLVLERSRSNGGLFSCFSARYTLDGWKIMKQSEAGRCFFCWRRDSLPLENASFCKSALPGCMGLLQNPVFHGTGLRCNFPQPEIRGQWAWPGAGCGWLRRRPRQGWLLGEKGGAGCTGHK